jgi:hypothetical protein
MPKKGILKAGTFLNSMDCYRMISMLIRIIASGKFNNMTIKTV